MPKIEIIAGSKSDEKFVIPIENILKENKLAYESNYLSAHRDKEKLSDYIRNSDADYFIAVAGLAAALPGSIAADTGKPVIAVPVWGGSSSSPGGLDALLAAIQMPPPKDGKNVALGCVAIDHPEYAAEFLLKCIRINKDAEYDVGFINVPEEYLQKITDLSTTLGLKSRKITVEPLQEELKKDKLHIILSDEPVLKRELVRYENQPLIAVPLLTSDETKIFGDIYSCYSPLLVAHIFKKMINMAPYDSVVAVGFNRIDNAAYFAKKLLGM